MQFDPDGAIFNLVHELFVVSRRSADALASAPSTASDPHRIVSVTVPSGDYPVVNISTLWSSTVPPESLGPTIVTTCASVGEGRTRAWADAVNSGEVFAPVGPAPNLPNLELPDFASMDRPYLDQLSRDTERQLSTIDQPPPPSLAAGADPTRLVEVSLRADGMLQSVDFDIDKIRRLPGEEIAEAVNAAIRNAAANLDHTPQTIASPLDEFVELTTQFLGQPQSGARER